MKPLPRLEHDDVRLKFAIDVLHATSRRQARDLDLACSSERHMEIFPSHIQALLPNLPGNGSIQVPLRHPKAACAVSCSFILTRVCREDGLPGDLILQRYWDERCEAVILPLRCNRITESFAGSHRPFASITAPLTSPYSQNSQQ